MSGSALDTPMMRQYSRSRRGTRMRCSSTGWAISTSCSWTTPNSPRLSSTSRSPRATGASPRGADVRRAGARCRPVPEASRRTRAPCRDLRTGRSAEQERRPQAGAARRRGSNHARAGRRSRRSRGALRSVAGGARPRAGGEVGFAALEASTGELRATAVRTDGGVLPSALAEELRRVAPREVLLPAHAARRNSQPECERCCRTPSRRSSSPRASIGHGAGNPGRFRARGVRRRHAGRRRAAALPRRESAFALSHVARLARYALAMRCSSTPRRVPTSNSSRTRSITPGAAR